MTAFQKAILNLLTVIILYQIALFCFVVFHWEIVGILITVVSTVILLIQGISYVLAAKFGSDSEE
jgi:hypothetical protein